jgi:hypothetical protein
VVDDAEQAGLIHWLGREDGHPMAFGVYLYHQALRVKEVGPTLADLALQANAKDCGLVHIQSWSALRTSLFHHAIVAPDSIVARQMAAPGATFDEYCANGHTQSIPELGRRRIHQMVE